MDENGTDHGGFQIYTKEREVTYDMMKKTKLQGLLFAAAGICLAFLIYRPVTAQAAESFISVKEINYEDSTMTLKVNQGDTIVYVSDSSKKNWEIVPGDISGSNTIEMDISWVPASKNYIMTLKGNSSTGITSVVIPKQASNFKASYNVAKGSISFSNAGTRAIQWRKKDSSIWNVVDTSTISTELGYFATNGASLYFRLAPINGTDSNDVGCRESREVSVTIPKKAAAPSVSINGSKFTIPVKSGMAYRTLGSDGTFTDWKNITKTSELRLGDIASEAMYSDGSTAQNEVTLQFRTNATSSKQTSHIAEITVPIQEGPVDADKYGISLSYDSSSSALLQVKSASDAMPFEYTIVKPGYELDYLNASWSTIKSAAGVSITKKAAPEESRIYVRKKSIPASDDIAFALASAALKVTDAGGTAYPDAPKAETLTNLVTVAGVCRTDNSLGYLYFALNSPVKTTVSTVDFYDIYGNKKGSASVKSTAEKNSGSTGASDRYIITTKITSTSDLDKVTSQVLYAKITLASGDVIVSDDTTGVHLYLYPATVLNSENTDYTSDFECIYMSGDADDKSDFTFQLDMGTEKVIDPSGIEKYTQEATQVQALRYNGYLLSRDTDYTVIYGSYTDDNGKMVPTATVTVHTAAFEQALTTTKFDTKLPLIIELNNEEVMNNAVTITLIPTAAVKNVPIAWSITEGSLQETKTSTVTDSDGNKISTTENVVTYKLSLTLFDPSYSVSVSDVTWGGSSIMGSAETSAGNVTISLSNAKINKLTTDSTDTKNMVITFSNGFVIKTGIKLTIINAVN